MSLEVSKIIFPAHNSGLSSTQIEIQNHFQNDVIFKLRSSNPKRFHIGGSHRNIEFPEVDLFLLEKLGNISIKVSVNLSKVPPNEKDRKRGFAQDRFQILYFLPTSTANLNVTEIWESCKVKGKPLQHVVDSIVKLPAEQTGKGSSTNSTTSTTESVTTKDEKLQDVDKSKLQQTQKKQPEQQQQQQQQQQPNQQKQPEQQHQQPKVIQSPTTTKSDISTPITTIPTTQSLTSSKTPRPQQTTIFSQKFLDVQENIY